MAVFLSLVFVLFIGYASGKSVDTAERAMEKAGPLNAMDNLHGVLMHGDSKQGEDHRGEDTMRVFQEVDELRNKGPAGPLDRMTELHDTLMHQDGKGDHDTRKDGPEMQKDFAVPDAMDNLHGVLMHGDGKQGKNHRHEDARKAQESMKNKGNMGVGNLMDDAHGVLMHGDRERGKDHKHEDAKLTDRVIPDGPIGADPEAALHGGAHKHNEKLKEPEVDFDPNRLWDKKQEKPLAFSFGKFISSDIMDGVDKLKRRYLSRFFGGGEKAGKSDSVTEDPAETDESRKVSPRVKAAYKIGPTKDDQPHNHKIPKHDET